MKKLFPCLAILLIAGALCSCKPKKIESNKLRVVTSIPAVYDWTRVILEEESNNRIYPNLLQMDGLTFHNHVPGTNEIEAIKNADLLIYVGGPSEKWIEDALKELPAQEGKERRCLKLIDSAQLKEEHFVLLPTEAITACQKITEALCLLDPIGADQYQKTFQVYKAQLLLLDTSYSQAAEKLSNKTFLICDRFPFKNLFEHYGFNYLCLYEEESCPVKGKASQERMQYLGSKLDELSLNAVYITESGDKKISNAVIAYSKNARCNTYVLNSFEGVSLASLFNDQSYINACRANLACLQSD